MATGDKLVNLDELKMVNDRVKPITEGGTNATTSAAARANLGITPANIGAMPYSTLPRDLNDASPDGIQIGYGIFENAPTIDGVFVISLPFGSNGRLQFSVGYGHGTLVYRIYSGTSWTAWKTIAST